MNDDLTSIPPGSSGEPAPQGQHPFELLAGYVEGTAEAAERREAEAHLSACHACRADVARATSARAALRSLSDMEAPGVAASVAASLGLDDAGTLRAVREGPQDDLAVRRARRDRQRGRAWSASLGAAAVLAAVFVSFAVLRSSERDGMSAGAPAAGTAAPTAEVAAADFTAASVDALLRQVGTARSRVALPAGSPDLQEPGSAPLSGPSPGGNDSSTLAAGAVDCLRAGSGLQPSDSPLSVIEGTFEDAPAYIGIFETQAGAQLSAVVVSRPGCRPLYVASQPA